MDLCDFVGRELVRVGMDDGVAAGLRPELGERVLLRGTSVGEMAHLGKRGEVLRRAKRRWWTRTELASGAQEERAHLAQQREDRPDARGAQPAARADGDHNACDRRRKAIRGRTRKDRSAHRPSQRLAGGEIGIVVVIAACQGYLGVEIRGLVRKY